MNNKYFFIHIPKSAGTSFRKILHSRFDNSTVYPSNNERKKTSSPYVNPSILKSLSRDRISKVNLFHGHLQHNVVDHLNYPFKKLTFLREPKQRIISNLHHFKRHRPKYKNSSLLDILKSENIRFDNRQLRYFLNSEINVKQLSSNHLHTALSNLSKLDFIGITEQYEDSISLLNYTFDWDLRSIEAINQNKLKKTKYYDIEEELNQELEDYVKFDNKFYQYGLALFNERKHVISLRTTS